MPFSWAFRIPDRVRMLPWLSLFVPVLLGIAGLVSIVTLRSLAIGHPVSDWSSWSDPQMLISGIGTVCVTTLTFGFTEGAKTSFWVRARKGMPLSDVHYAWESTTSVAEAGKAIWRGKSLSVAWLTILVVVAIPGNAWLWAHSFYQDDVTLSYNGTANIHITPKIMLSQRLTSMLTINFPIMEAYRGYLSSSTVQFPLDICEKCSVDTLGFGWLEMCSVSTGGQYNFESVSPDNGPQTLFVTNISDKWGPSGHLLTINTTYKSETGCTGDYLTHYCVLRPSIVQYRFNVTGNSITFTTVSTDTAMDDSMFSYYQDFLGNSFFPLPLKPSLYDGRLELFAKLGKSLHSTNFGAARAGFWWHYDEDTFGVSNQNHIAAAYAHNPDYLYQVNSGPEQEHPCKLDFVSPMDDILDMYRQLAIRVSVIAAVHTNDTQYVPFIGERTERQWLANKKRAQLCFYAAMITHIVGILLVVYLHWDFWKLDREYSMSPLELMNAVAHGSDESTRSLLHILREAEDNASASRLKEFADEWDAEHEKLLVYTKGRDGQWGFEVEVEEFEMTEQL